MIIRNDFIHKASTNTEAQMPRIKKLGNVF
jgi:hypothetical protein